MNIQERIKRLTIGEVAAVEEISGVSLTSMADPASPKARVMIALVYTLEKRHNPQVKLNHIQQMTLEQLLQRLTAAGEEGDDTKSE